MKNEDSNKKYEELDLNNNNSINKSPKDECRHDWQLLDLGTGDYGAFYCEKCGQFKRDLEKQ